MALDIDLVDFPPPQNVGRLTNNDVLLGLPIPAIDRLKIFSPDQFEDFIREWVVGYLMKKGTYTSCKKSSGSGDMGRDVIGVVDATTWDNFQCKHYDAPLTPSEINVELGKLVYYTFKGHFTLPRNYYFVAPKGAGPKLNNLLGQPDELKKQLIENWTKHCQTSITTTKEEIALDDDLLAHLNTIDFRIFSCYDPQTIIDEHFTTPYYAARFGGGLRKKREIITATPPAIHADELIYTEQLFKAYSDHTKSPITEFSHLASNAELESHFKRQRLGFYSADSLNQFSRDTLPPGEDHFQDLKNEFHDGLIDIVEDTHKDGYQKIKATTGAAKALIVDSSPLSKALRVADREGICHHLVNESRFKWV